MLRLLHKTRHPAWADIQLSDQNMQAWDVDGDIADTLARRRTNVVVERDENGQEVTADVDVYEQDATGHPRPRADGQVETLNDGGDTGPAELQNTEIEEETYEAVMHLGETSHVGLENAQQAADEVTRAVREIRRQAADSQDNDDVMHLRGGDDTASTVTGATVNRDGSAATIRHEDAYTTVGYPDMLKEPWAFARAFPTLFPPR